VTNGFNPPLFFENKEKRGGPREKMGKRGAVQTARDKKIVWGVGKKGNRDRDFWNKKNFVKRKEAQKNGTRKKNSEMEKGKKPGARGTRARTASGVGGKRDNTLAKSPRLAHTKREEGPPCVGSRGWKGKIRAPTCW